MNKNFCDRCEKEINYNMLDHMRAVLSINYALPFGNNYDLCKSCIIEFKEFMENK